MNKLINIEKVYKNKKEKSFRTTTIILIILMIILLLFSGYSMAKTIEEIIIKANAQVAEPIFIIENDPSVDITAVNNNGIYTFKIKNYNEEDKITETDLKYYIEVLSNLDSSISIEIYQNGNKINFENNKTEYMTISKDKKEEIEYKIKITYDKDKSTNINDIIEKIQVKVHTEQIKA